MQVVFKASFTVIPIHAQTVLHGLLVESEQYSTILPKN